ncbi:MAG TPA: hypothetical protein VG435_09200 [Acidimicrobiales bacterium]|nr:hypothetical protein [Acidimicrobiales bacterium]
MTDRPPPTAPTIANRLAIVWLLVPLAAVIPLAAGRPTLAVAAGGATAVLLASASRPRWALLALAAIYPFQLLLLALVLHLGAPEKLTRYSGEWAEVAVAGMVLAGIRVWVERRSRIEWIDWCGIVYLAVVVAYRFLASTVLHHGPISASALDTSLRNDTMFVVIFLAVRRLGPDRTASRRFAAVVFAVGLITSATAVFEYLRSSTWNHFVVYDLWTTVYEVKVLGVAVPNVVDIREYDFHGRLLTGSVFLDRLAFSLYLVMAIAIGCRYLCGTTRFRYLIGAGTLLIGTGLILAQSRDAVAAAVVAAVLIVRPLWREGRARRIRLLSATGLTVVVLVPVAFAVGFASRTSSALAGTDPSTRLHESRSASGLEAFLASPLGRGLGTGGTNGTRFGISGTIVNEDSYLQIANETGILSLLPFVALTITGIVMLIRRARAPDQPDLPYAWQGAFLGLSLACLGLTVWLELPVAVTAWMGLGLSLPVVVSRREAVAASV